MGKDVKITPEQLAKAMDADRWIKVDNGGLTGTCKMPLPRNRQKMISHPGLRLREIRTCLGLQELIYSGLYCSLWVIAAIDYWSFDRKEK
jgi:hypothetical protein